MVAEKVYVSPDEYLRLERAAEFKSEYVNGEIIPMGEYSRPNGWSIYKSQSDQREYTIRMNCTFNCAAKVAGVIPATSASTYKPIQCTLILTL